MGCDFSQSEKANLDKNQLTMHNVNKENILFNKMNQLVGEKKGNIENLYTFEKDIGEGAFGKVKLATQKSTGMTRAVKIVSRQGLSKNEEKALKNEIEILQALDHPHIIKVYEYFIDKNSYYIVTEYCSGGELFDRIVKNGSFSERKAAQVMTQLLLAINYCHKNNIVHRDLKPENLLYENLADNSPLKLIDFGTSVFVGSKGKLKENVGTSFYIAPEVLKEKYDEKCDLWSCGVILYILLAGFPPFQGETDDDIHDKVLKGEYNIDEPELMSVTQDAKNLMKRFLTMNPSKRISAEEALKDKWITKHNELSNTPLTGKVLKNMKTFRADQKIQLATWNFFTNFLTMNEEKDELLKVFKDLDINGDGRLTREELLAGYRSIMSETQAVKIVDEIMTNADVDNSGEIEYNEFLMATINREKLLTQEKLEKAFQLFDEDGNGYISLNEFKHAFCQDSKISSEQWNEMMAQVDEDNDGKVSCEEFKKMMKKLLSNS